MDTTSTPLSAREGIMSSRKEKVDLVAFAGSARLEISRSLGTS